MHQPHCRQQPAFHKLSAAQCNLASIDTPLEQAYKRERTASKKDKKKILRPDLENTSSNTPDARRKYHWITEQLILKKGGLPIAKRQVHGVLNAREAPAATELDA
jgi:hypothetical protein